MVRDWYKRNPADALDGMSGMSLELVGAYNILLDTIYLYGRSIPDDDRHVAGLLRVSTRRWRGLRKQLLEAGKLVSEEGRLNNVRAQFELKNNANLSRTRVNSGRTGGETTQKRRKTRGVNQANAYARRGDKIREDTEAKASAEIGSEISTSKFIYDMGKQILQNADPPVKNPGALITRWLGKFGDGAVLNAIQICETKRTPKPVEFMTAILQNRKSKFGNRPIGYETLPGTFDEK